MSLIWQYLLIFLGVAIEGPGVTLTGAALAGSGHLNPFVVFLCAATGNLAGDLCWYLLGYYGRFDTLVERVPYFAHFAPKVDQLKAQVAKEAARLLFSAKLALGVASIPALVAVGMTRIPLQGIVLAQVSGEVIWTGSLVLLGFLFGQSVARLQKDLQIAALVVGVILIVLIIWTVRRQIKSDNCIHCEQAEHRP